MEEEKKEEEEQPKGRRPVRVRLVFADRTLLTQAQRSEGLRRCLVVINPHLKTVAELSRDIAARFGLSGSSTAGHGILLSMDGFSIPLCESTAIFRDNDKIRVRGFIAKKKKKEKKKMFVAPPSDQPQSEPIELADKGTTVFDNGICITDNGDDLTEKEKKKRKRPLPEEISSKEGQEEIATCSKKMKSKLVANKRPSTTNEGRTGIPAPAAPSQYHTVNQQSNALVTVSQRKKKLKLVGNERPSTTNERRTSIPAVAASSQYHTVNHQQSNAPVIVSQRIEQAVSISKCTSTRFYSGRKDKNVLGACYGNDNQHSLSGHWIPGQARFMSPGAGPSNWQDNGPRKSFQGDDGSRARKTWKPRNGYIGPNTHNRAKQQRQNSIGLASLYVPLTIGNEFTTGEAAEKIHPHEEDNNKDKLDFESLDPVPRLPMEGDIIAYRLDIIDSLGCPGLSPFRVGKVIVFDPVLMIIFLHPLPEYPTQDCDMSEFEKDMYKEDGSVEIDFESLVDLRLVKESQLKNVPRMHNSGKEKGKSKASSCQDNAGTSLSLLGNDNSVKSAWEVGESSNANAAAESDWGAWAPSTSRCGASGPSEGHYASGFGSHADFSRGWNNDGRNNNSSSPWDTNIEATNANGGTQSQQNGWDVWEPSTSRTGASWRCMGQNHNTFRSGGGYFTRGGRRGRGGKLFNRKFNK